MACPRYSSYFIQVLERGAKKAGHAAAAAAASLSADMGRLGDGVNEDADAVGAVIHGHRRAGGQHDDVGIGLVLEDHLLGFLYAEANHLRPRRLGAAAPQCCRHRRRGAHGRRRGSRD